MKHFIILFYFISLTMGFSFLILSVVVWLKNKHKLLKYLILCIFSLTLILMEQMISAYDLINVIDNKSWNILITYAQTIGCGLMIYSLNMLELTLIKRSLSKKGKVLLFSLSILPFIITTFSLLMNNERIIRIGGLIFFGVILYSILQFIKNINQVSNLNLRSALRNFISISLGIFPILVIDVLIEKLPKIGIHFPFGLLSVTLFYSILSGLGLYYMVKNYDALLNHLISANIGNDNSDFEAPESKKDEKNSLTSYNITKREKEIIELLVIGNSYNEISEKLMISLPTVKTHVHNIYRKLNIKNKVELINIVAHKY